MLPVIADVYETNHPMQQLLVTPIADKVKAIENIENSLAIVAEA